MVQFIFMVSEISPTISTKVSDSFWKICIFGTPFYSHNKLDTCSLNFNRILMLLRDHGSKRASVESQLVAQLEFIQL